MSMPRTQTTPAGLCDSANSRAARGLEVEEDGHGHGHGHQNNNTHGDMARATEHDGDTGQRGPLLGEVFRQRLCW